MTPSAQSTQQQPSATHNPHPAAYTQGKHLASTDAVPFPDGFLWAAATSSYQVEGAAHEDGRTDSVWDAFTRVPGAVLSGHDGEVACDQYHRYVEDADLMRSMNLGAYRFSISWARVCPDAGPVNPKGLDYYSRLVDTLLERDILPWVTLFHWDHPQSLEASGGWGNRDTALKFVDYSLAVHEALQDRVSVWTTLNEPWCSSMLSYGGGTHAPGDRDYGKALAAAHHQLLGHGLVVQELRQRQPQAELGITLNFTVADPVDPADPRDVDAARRIDGQFNRLFADPIFRGAYPLDLLEDLEAEGLRSGFEEKIQDGDMAAISSPIDALGVNYYHGEEVSYRAYPEPLQGSAPVERPTQSPHAAAHGIHGRNRGLPHTAQQWEVQPEGMTRLLLRLQEEYTGPAGTALYITENGCAYDDVPDAHGYVEDTDRLEFYDVHLRAVRDAMEAGADVRGYFAWSLLDNFEWAWGYHQRFGIVRVDFETQERTVKASGKWFSEVARTNVVPARGTSGR
ncbi:beta-glucosidase [Flavimobilis marinus]|uniref:Beta-glucosidase n=1 Tax=Flavimobilis marinus TaxID=285351 RepID=A0A1I2HGV0_9MICO|nr:GH1 family beta-glucosidase [Flavimobilis marinus]GHG57837.1 beta-glucosidase [Flavimobilis marinus]SFF28107.1 beta-glucosidase [Flavimobilis marinus]